jgi:hypothetical protein
MNTHPSCRERIAEAKKRFMTRYSYVNGDSLIMYLDEPFLLSCMRGNGFDDVPHTEKCMGIHVRIGSYREGSSELPPFTVLIEHKGRPDRFVSDTEELCRQL